MPWYPSDFSIVIGVLVVLVQLFVCVVCCVWGVVFGRGFPWEPPKHLGCFGLVVALSCALRPYALISLFAFS